MVLSLDWSSWIGGSCRVRGLEWLGVVESDVVEPGVFGTGVVGLEVVLGQEVEIP